MVKGPYIILGHEIEGDECYPYDDSRVGGEGDKTRLIKPVWCFPCLEGIYQTCKHEQEWIDQSDQVAGILGACV